jgi:hypothetical protein
MCSAQNCSAGSASVPRAVKHAQREAILLARNLVVVELHRIDGTAAKFIVLRVGPKTEAKSTRA